MIYSLGFSKKKMEVNISDLNSFGVLQANKVEIDLIGELEIIRAIKNPINSQPLSKIIKAGEKIAIVTSDITRPMPSKVVLTPLIEELNRIGVKDEDIIIVFALGSHRSHTEEEKISLVGKNIYQRIKCVDRGVDGFKHFGYTNSGTPVDICKIVADADRRICLGNIEYHYFAGYSGGVKAIMPGVATRDAIQANHSMMVNEQAYAGNINTNPVRADIDSIIKFIPIDFIVNVVLDEKKNIIKAVAGHCIDAHREGCDFLDSIYKISIKEKADIVITSAGGFPKDLNLYQAQKALDNAKHAVRKGGIIIVVASCQEGFGDKIFEEWILSTNKTDEIIERIKNEFKLGGHKAAAIAMVLETNSIYLVSEMKKDQVNNNFFVMFNDVQSALNCALQKLGRESKVLIIPHGGSILPLMKH